MHDTYHNRWLFQNMSDKKVHGDVFTVGEIVHHLTYDSWHDIMVQIMVVLQTENFQ